MKCPKCNYVSHDYLDACRKCGINLVAFKQEIGLVVLQPGVLDLSLVLGGAGADDLFESVEEEVIMHAGDDDDFDISLDDYVDQQSLRRPVGAVPSGDQPTVGGQGGLDHLTLELDAADLPEELTHRLQASQALPGALTPPAVPSEPAPAEPSSGPSVPPTPTRAEPQPRLEISRALGLGVGSVGLTAAAAAAAAALTQPTAPASAAPQESQPLMLTSDHIDLTPATPRDGRDPADEDEGEGEAATVVNISGPMPSLQLQDVSLADEPDAADPTMPTIELLDVDAAVEQINAEFQGEPPETPGATSALLNSFELTVDDTAFALGGTTAEAPETLPEVSDMDMDTETDLDIDMTRLESTAFAAAMETRLPELETADLEAVSLALPDDAEHDSLLSSTLLPLQDTLPDAGLQSLDMFALGESVDDEEAFPGHLTLELNAPTFSGTEPVHLPDETDPEAPFALPPTPAAAPPSTEHNFTVSDALALGDLEDDEAPPADRLTLSLDVSDLPDLASLNLEDSQLDELQSDLHSSASAAPGEPRGPDEEEFLLDLDDFESLDEDNT